MVKNLLKKIISNEYNTDFDILTPPDPKMGDYSVNLAFILAKKEKKNPKELSEELAAKFSKSNELSRYFGKIEAVGGFVNFYISNDFLRSQLLKILEQGENFGSGEKKNYKINLEFVSANPTGPLTVHNVRAAPYGDALASILKKSGYDVTKEYYINDAGNQVRLLGESVARRYLRLKGKTIDFPDNLYQGEYIIDIAKEVEKDGLVDQIENFDELVLVCKDYALKKLTSLIIGSLKRLGVEFDVWFSEEKLYETGEAETTLRILDKGKHVYEKDGAKWLKIDNSGERDAVLVKSDGAYSYLMGDIAYTRNKFMRGFNKAVNIWGADHHGDVLRLMTGVKFLNYEDEALDVLLHQLISIKVGGETKRMSKRKGELVIFDELLEEVGGDVIRFFFLMKDLNTHMEFDIDLAKKQSNKNPVYYVQYEFARLNSILAKSKEQRAKSKNFENLELLKEKEEFLLMRSLVKFPELVEEISKNYQVHHLAQYSFSLASVFHNFYEKHKVIQDDKNLERARLELCRATATILKTTLSLMGISAPERMDGKESEGA